MVEAGRFYHEAAGAIKDRPEVERAEAHEQLGPPFVHVWVAFLCSLAATKGLAPEHVITVKTCWEGNVVKSSPVQLAAHVRHCRAKPCRDRCASCSASIRLLSQLEPALEAALLLQKRVRNEDPSREKHRSSWHRCGRSGAPCSQIGGCQSAHG